MKKSELKDGMKVKYRDLPKDTMFLAGGLLCIKNNEKECFIFQSYSETPVTTPDAIVEVTGIGN